MSVMMVLMAGLTVGSDGTEPISTETDQVVSLHGYWEGTGQGLTLSQIEPVALKDGDLVMRGPAWMQSNRQECLWFTEGKGRLSSFR
jgi:hypothetical protein